MKSNVIMEDSVPAIACAMPPVIIDNLVNIQQGLQILMADISELPRNDESLKYVKQVRANLSKELDKMESQRKAAKKKALEPYERAESKYKEYISGPYKEADAQLKAWVDSYQNELKAYCLKTLREYFDELCQAYDIDFISFEQTGIVVDMAMARQVEPKKAMEKIYNQLKGVREDMDTILKMENAAALMVEYRKHPVLSAAVLAVEKRNQEQEQMQNFLAAQQQRMEDEQKNVAAILEAAPDVLPEQEDRFTVSFTATGSIASLRAMKAYGISLGITFKETIEEEENDE